MVHHMRAQLIVQAVTGMAQQRLLVVGDRPEAQRERQLVDGFQYEIYASWA